MLWSKILRSTVAMGRHGSPWLATGCHGLSWVVMGRHGSPWVVMGRQGPSWVATGCHGSPWVVMSHHSQMRRRCKWRSFHHIVGRIFERHFGLTSIVFVDFEMHLFFYFPKPVITCRFWIWIWIRNFGYKLATFLDHISFWWMMSVARAFKFLHEHNCAELKIDRSNLKVQMC